jgi:hypothetical protein
MLYARCAIASRAEDCMRQPRLRHAKWKEAALLAWVTRRAKGRPEARLTGLTGDRAGPDLENFKMNSRSRVTRAVLLIAVVLLSGVLGSAKSSKVVMSWRSLDAPAGKFHRVLALGLSEKTGIRADFEDALAIQLGEAGLEAIPGNTLLLRPEGTQLDLNYLRTQVRENKIEAVVVSRLIQVEKTVTYVPGAPYFVPYPYYGTFYGYYGTVYPMVYSPDYLREDKKVRIETNLYVISAPDGKLVWTGITDTFNPTNVHKAINGLVKLVVKQMQNEGVF